MSYLENRSLSHQVTSVWMIAMLGLGACTQRAQPTVQATEDTGPRTTVSFGGDSTAAVTELAVTPTPTEVLVPTLEPTFTATPEPTITPTPTEAPLSNKRNEEVGLEEVGMYSEATSFSMKPRDSHQLWIDLVFEPFRTSPALDRYRANLMGISRPTPEQWLQFLRKSIGPEGRPYYLPPEAGRIPLTLLGGAHQRSPVGKFRVNPVIQSGGVYLDLARVAFEPATVTQEVKDMIKVWSRNNWGDYGSSPLFCWLAPELGCAEKFGVLVDDYDNSLVYMVGNEVKFTAEEYEYWKNIGEVKKRIPWALGGIDGTFRQDNDPKIVTAELMTLARAITYWKPEWEKSVYICTMDDNICSHAKVGNSELHVVSKTIGDDELWFVPSH